MSVATQYNCDQLIEEFKINGFIILEDFISDDKLDRIYEAWIPIRDREIERQGNDPNRGPNRYSVILPLEAPFVDPDIFEHPTLVKLFENVLGEDYICRDFNSKILEQKEKLFFFKKYFGIVGSKIADLFFYKN